MSLRGHDVDGGRIGAALPHVPGSARFQYLLTLGTGLQITFNDDSFGIGIFSMGTMVRPFLHLSSLAVFEFGLSILPIPLRQQGYTTTIFEGQNVHKIHIFHAV
jgi:hypothetical protein